MIKVFGTMLLKSSDCASSLASNLLLKMWYRWNLVAPTTKKDRDFGMEMGMFTVATLVTSRLANLMEATVGALTTFVLSIVKNRALLSFFSSKVTMSQFVVVQLLERSAKANLGVKF